MIDKIKAYFDFRIVISNYTITADLHNKTLWDYHLEEVRRAQRKRFMKKLGDVVCRFDNAFVSVAEAAKSASLAADRIQEAFSGLGVPAEYFYDVPASGHTEPNPRPNNDASE